ncbi:hypothetical protein RUMCAL_03238 [Ruminococcus callidus ATCC 27760]|uniref:Uncharacterized protein n=1 Tax=Ruminococcus callidus ATCC 27760 TaxID=411473 RepID=U2LE38_9FIRM|nr:hypothetical protein RUMCAL_03238 [Ruminococcus callidus ATCC 27760]
MHNQSKTVARDMRAVVFFDANCENNCKKACEFFENMIYCT